MDYTVSDAAPATPAPAPVAPAPAVPAPASPIVDTRALVEAERAKAAAEIDAARKSAAEEVAKVRAEADAKILEVEATSVLRGIGVLRSQLAVIGGKLVSAADPTKSATDTIKAWVEGEGKYMLGPSIPAGGSGAPPTASAPPQAPTHNLRTNEGAQARADDTFLAAMKSRRS